VADAFDDRFSGIFWSGTAFVHDQVILPQRNEVRECASGIHAYAGYRCRMKLDLLWAHFNFVGC
jgi:hypothetical protein